ncbi:MAG: pantoate--beta-alanine ligase [Bacteroidetes bacterium]|nr:pantoate--beta-alanine ligase [Bacteroidota bacterium]
MRIVTDVLSMQREAERLRKSGQRIVLVPTMGYLHAGHESLISRARVLGDVVVVSVFVNPTQFAPNEDYTRYPRDFKRDVELAENAGAHIIFHPSVEEMYTQQHSTFIDCGDVTQRFEGAFRPTHFRGVTTVVAKLFNITRPHVAVFGQKDAQQAFIIKKMVSELNFDIEIVVAPIVREVNGLALSSRNTYLSPAERERATALYRALQHSKKRILEGFFTWDVIRNEMRTILEESNPTQIDYIAFIDPATFEELTTVPQGTVLVALAVRYGSTRLIDNLLIHRD